MKKILVYTALLSLLMAGSAFAAVIATVNVSALSTTFTTDARVKNVTTIRNAGVEISVPATQDGKAVIIGKGVTDGVTGKVTIFITSWPGTVAPFKAGITKASCKLRFYWRGTASWNYIMTSPLYPITNFNIMINENSKWEPMGCNKER